MAKPKIGPLRKKLNDLLEMRTQLKKSYANMRPGRDKTRITVDLASLDQTIKALRSRIALHTHKKLGIGLEGDKP